MDIREIDKLDEGALRAWWDCGHETAQERPYDFWPPWVLSRVALPRPNPEQQVTLLSAYDDAGVVVGCALLQLPQVDNPRVAYADVSVPPRLRRRGTGAALLAEIERRARAGGRSVLLVEVFTPPGVESDGSRFGLARGFAVATTEHQKVLDLPASEPGWPALQEWVDERRAGYRIVEWGNAAPEELLDGYAALLTGFMDQVPLGDLDLEGSVWTPERIRTNEARIEAIGRVDFHAAALTPDGNLCGVTDLRLVDADPRVAHVGITNVLDGHRGHRLGVAMKLAAQRSVRAAYPACELVVTDNAGVNAPMNAVNDRLGYTVVEDLLELQKHLD